MPKAHPVRKLLIIGLAALGEIVLFLQPKAYCQSQIGFIMAPTVDKVEIEFERYNNLIVIPLQINNQLSLKFVLDTGAESIILTEKLFADFLNLNFIREITLNAPGVADSITAFVAHDVSLSLDKNLKADNMNVLVLAQDYIELQKNLGEEVYGIIGYEIFHRYVVDIQYDDNKLIIHRPETYKPKRFQTEVPITVSYAKPFIPMVIEQNGLRDTLIFMVDTGASHAALVDVSTSHRLIYPKQVIPTRLGRGLGGEIPGKIGRMNKCIIDKYEFSDVLVSIPEDGAYSKAIKRGTKYGTIGGDLLSRFNVVFDYVHEKMYLDKGHNYKSPFEYNMSGMSLMAEGDDLDQIIVTHVIDQSPAHVAGIQAGDIVIKINGQNLINSSLGNIQHLLRSRPRKKIRVTFLRHGEKIKSKFRLKRLI
ncbi:aspartyl protease family protein [Marinoscillum sp. MHG1-6]|uniref:aspartyl protease family protein n=1 Tax=Marinoscillum sp. MHG1-6 TaxID=2959627 RepID=UPI00215746DC|nr:aspartyl protease family protein [Marinoscillum sp. MHG1-6]